jgi:hypothetical protein
MLKLKLKVLQRKSRTPSAENAQSKDEIEREVALTMELRKLLSTFQSSKRDIIGYSDTIWTALLPLELIYLITDLYCSDDLETLRALAGVCKILYCYCRRHIYRTVIVSPRTETVNDSSFPERFARFVAQTPQILDYIQTLRCKTVAEEQSLTR